MISTIILWPDSFDFPLFRKNLTQLQQYVDEVIICFTSHGNHSLKDWLRDNLPGCKLLDADMYQAQQYGGDWRNKATNLMIDHAQGDWILSLEQDFLIKDYAHFFSTVKGTMDKHNVISFQENNRFHPAFFLVKKSELNKTSRDFSVQGEHKDHFWLVGHELKQKSPSYIMIDVLGLFEKRDWYHMGGLTENYFSSKPYYRLDEFHTYNDACLALDLPISEYWRGEMERCKDVDRPEKLSLHLGKFL